MDSVDVNQEFIQLLKAANSDCSVLISAEGMSTEPAAALRSRTARLVSGLGSMRG